MSYYQSIATEWHCITGRSGGAFKSVVLNRQLIEMVDQLSDCNILELGAGNGYFMPLLLRRFSGQIPSRVVISDSCKELINIAEKQFNIPFAEYTCLDVRKTFPFEHDTFDLIIATMLLNELTTGAVRRALDECHRVLSPNGVMIVTVLHPDFIQSLHKRGLLRRNNRGLLTMPGAESLRLPVVRRTRESYMSLLDEAGFDYEAKDLFPTPEVISQKPGLKKAGKVPLALVFKCHLI